MHKDFIFREYDIRGVYNKQFDNDFAILLGRALVTYHSIKIGKKKSEQTKCLQKSIQSAASFLNTSVTMVIIIINNS